MDLRKLRHVHALAQAGSFVRAADELHITQSALTRSVQLLESELRIKIFDRGRTGVRVTAVGRLLINRAADILAAVRGLELDIGAAGRADTGFVSFGLGPLPASIFLAHLLSDITRNHAGVHVAVETNTATALLESLVAERIELCVCSLAIVPITRKVTIRPLAVLPLGFFVRAQHPLNTSRRVALREVLKYPVITGNVSGQGLENLRQRAGLLKDELLPFAIACDDFHALKSVTLNSDAVWLTSSFALAEERVAKSLVQLQTPLRGLSSVEIVAVSLAGRSLSPAAELVLNKITERATRLMLDADPPPPLKSKRQGRARRGETVRD